MYGIVEKKEFTKEIGVWLQEEEGFISFEVKIKAGQSSFTEYPGKLFPDRIELSLPFYFKGPEGKKDIEQYFAKFGLRITNM